MRNTNLKIKEAFSTPELQLIQGGALPDSSRTSALRPSREMLILASVLILLQILDGLLTAIGVSHYGVETEANPLIKALMLEFGAFVALFGVKSLAIAVIGILCWLSCEIRWLPLAVKGLILLYLSAAILPWCILLGSKIFGA